MSKNRSYAHKKAQKQGKIRDNYTCQICGLKDKTKVQGHHIFDVAFNGAATEENIITLCEDCHKKVHKGLIDIIKF